MNREHRLWYLLKRYLFHVIIFGILFVAMYPVLWMIFGSLKDDQDFYNNVWGVPKRIIWFNYITAWDRANLTQKYINTVFVTAMFLVILIPVNACAAYPIARLRFKGRNLIYMYLLIGVMIPVGILAMPSFSVAVKLRLINSLPGLAFFYIAQAIAFGVFLMRSFFISLPSSLEDAALIDGCNRFKSFLYVILPLAKSGIMTQVIYNGLTVWNEYLLASLFIRSSERQTLPLGLSVFVNQYNVYYPELFAALVLVTFPMVMVYIIGQKMFIEGITAGAVKG
jgi:ABC-type glycerol-3-phosphate transport system permease component